MVQKDQKISLSIVILNYNGLEYLKETLPALLKLDRSKYEYIVVDNGSTDGSISFIRGFEEVLLIENKMNHGYSKGKNIGVETARGEYVFLLDEDILITNTAFDLDDVVASMKLESMLAVSFLLKDASSEKTEYYGGYYSLYGIKERKRIDYKDIIASQRSYIKIPSPDGGALLIKKMDFISSGSYDTSQPYFIDVGDFGIRASILTGRSNYLYTKEYFIHLGEKRKTDNAIWRWKFTFVLPGLTKIILKNYTFLNVVKCYPITFIFVFIKMLKQLIQRRDLLIIPAYIKSILITFYSVCYILQRRKWIQSRRVVRKDSFLEIQIPKFDKV